MTEIAIPENLEFTTQQAADLLGIPQSRVQMLVAKHKLANRTIGGPSGPGHYRIRYADLDKLKKIHESTRQVGVSSSKNALSKRVDELEKQMENVASILDRMSKHVQDLVQFVDEFTAPVVESVEPR